MPTYEYLCEKCDNAFDVIHSFKESPVIFCPLCSGKSIKQITSFYMGTKASPSKKEMEQDLRENYGIHNTQMRNGSFGSFYAGVKRDGDKVREQMKKGEEDQNNSLAKKSEKFFKKPIDHDRILKIQERKAEKAYKDRKLTLPNK